MTDILAPNRRARAGGPVVRCRWARYAESVGDERNHRDRGHGGEPDDQAAPARRRADRRNRDEDRHVREVAQLVDAVERGVELLGGQHDGDRRGEARAGGP